MERDVIGDRIGEEHGEDRRQAADPQRAPEQDLIGTAAEHVAIAIERQRRVELDRRNLRPEAIEDEKEEGAASAANIMSMTGVSRPTPRAVSFRMKNRMSAPGS